MPEGLEIDHTSKLEGTMATYDVHLILHTSVTDWPSRVEDDERFPEVKLIKNMLGKNGEYFNPFHNVMISTSGDAPGVRPEVPDSDAEKSNNLYPQHVGYQEEDAVQQRIASQDPKRITIIPNILASEPQPVYMSSPFDEIRLGKSSATFEDAAEALIRESLLPRDLSPQAKRFIPEDQHARLIRHTRNSQIPALGVPSNDLGADGKHTEERNASNQSVSNGPPRLERPPSTDPLSSIKVLICGHGNRDQRCGITGPILAQEFKRQLRKNEHVHHEHFDVELISHIGGHKYAGNVIIYFPETDVWKTRYLQTLSGMGIWYGRVEPRHVEGILEQTVFGGQIIKELFRGGIDGRGGQLRLANIESVALGTASTGYRPRSGWLKRMRVDT